MKTVFQLAKLLKEDWPGRGIIREIAEYTGLERHTISTLLHNGAKYISLETIGRICDYLVHKRGVDPAILPGALFGKERDGFWEMLADRKQVSFSLATRSHSEWPDAEYVMASDSHLHGVLVAHVSGLDGSAAQHGVMGTAQLAAQARSATSHDENAVRRFFSDPHLIAAPRRIRTKKGSQQAWQTIVEGQDRAVEIYQNVQRQAGSSVAFTIGSVKVNAVLEVLLADIFDTVPFVTQDNVTHARQRACPFYFRYREIDPAPVSLCGGTRLSKRQASEQPGIYYETQDEGWACCPWELDKHDVAFVVYAYRPAVDELQLACGGFSGRATGYLAERFSSVASQFWEPQFQSPDLHVGLFLVDFDIRKSARGRKRNSNSDDFKHHVIRIDESVLARRLSNRRE